MDMIPGETSQELLEGIMVAGTFSCTIFIIKPIHTRPITCGRDGFSTTSHLRSRKFAQRESSQQIQSNFVIDERTNPLQEDSRTISITRNEIPCPDEGIGADFILTIT